MLLMPSLQAVTTIHLMHLLFTFRPSHPRWLRVFHDAAHLIRHGQFRVYGGSKWMDQFRPVVIPQPEHRAAVGAEIALAGTLCFVGGAARFDCGILPSCRSAVVPPLL